MRWSDAHRIAMLQAFETQEELGLETRERIDVFAAMSAAGVKLMFRPLDCAALYLSASIAGRPGALVNALHPPALQRYSAAHEFGHHVFDHGGQVDRDGEPHPPGAALAPEEMLAEAFAAWFLMPPETIERALTRLGLDAARTPADAYALSLRLGTSYRATCNRIGELNRWRDTAVKSIKQSLVATAPPGGWRHDVWVLSAADAQAPVVARSGDVLLVERADWDIEAVPCGATVEIFPGPDLLSPGRWRVDLPTDLPAGPAQLVLRQPQASLTFELDLQRPRLGRYVPFSAGRR